VKKYPESKLKLNRQGRLFDDCKELIKKLNLEEKVKFLDNIKSWDELPLVYKNSDILLFPAKFSNGNFTILEAMASGMGIVISNKIKGTTNLFEGESGYICSLNKREFLDSIQEYIDHPEKFRKHGEINRNIVKSKSGQGTAELYKYLIGQLYE